MVPRAAHAVGVKREHGGTPEKGIFRGCPRNCKRLGSGAKIATGRGPDVHRGAAPRLGRLSRSTKTREPGDLPSPLRARHCSGRGAPERR